MKNWKQFLGALQPAEREPLEVRNAILEAIEALVQPLGGGRRGLVHNRIAVRLLTPADARRAVIKAVLADLPEAARTRLEAGGCSVPADLAIEVSESPSPAATSDFELVPSIESSAAAPREPQRRRPRATLTLPDGTVFEIASDVVNVGRVQEVRGSDHLPVRRNHLYFGESAAGVSRRHAHIRYDPAAGEFRLFDDRSARGTRLFSNGEPIDVPPGRGRGELLHSGDEIYFGPVCVRFDILDA